MKKTNYRWLLLSLIFLGYMLVGCNKETPQPQPEAEEVAIESTYVEILADSLDEAIIVSVSEGKKEIKFYNLVKGRTYTLTYDGTTGMKNRFGDEIVPGQLTEGDMVRVTFIKDEKRIKSIQLLETVDTYQDIDVFEINKAARIMEFKGEQYNLHENCLVLSRGKSIQLEEIHATDYLKIVAADHKVYGITVEKGHGYVRLSGHDAFVGGWIEVGQAVITEVSEEMLLVVPEGTYTLYISHDGVAGSKEVVVSRGEETLVDVSDLQTEKIKKTGKIIFTITPTEAELYVDGELTDYSSEVELDYGIHQIKIKADGYHTLKQYIKVGEPTATLNIKLEETEAGEEDKEDEEEETDESVSGNSVSGITSASDYRVYIDAPTGAELYLDGNYVGVVPTNFAKKEGTYVISLRKDGYQTRSYTLQLDDAQKDVSYSFSDLITE